MLPLPTLLALVLAPALSQDGSLRDLQPLAPWKRVAHGVFEANVGNAAAELRYSELAGAAPRLEALNALRKATEIQLPASLRRARGRVHGDGRISVSIPTVPGERIYGYGLQFDRTLHSGRILELKVDHFNKGGGKTHAPVPFFVSSEGYGVLFDTARYLKVHNQVGSRKDSANNPAEVDRNPPSDEEQPGPWLAVPPGDAVEASLMGEGLSLVAFAGADLMEVVSRYNLFSGGGAMPPLWGLGFWHRTPSKYSAAEVESEVAAFEEHGIPLDVIGLEPGWQTKSYPCTFEWQPKRFPDPAAFTRRLAEKGIRVNLWVNPYVSKSARIYDALYPLSGSHLVWLGLVPDYTLPAAREVLLEQHRADHLAIGISGYKVDEVDGYDRWLWPDHATFPSGRSAETMRQSYGMQMQRMLKTELFDLAGQRTYSLVRASNGAASAYPFVLYSDSYAHREYVTGLSSASLSGLLWCPEIRSAKTEREWINRMHTVCLSPLAQLNAWSSGTKPWSYPDATDAVRRTIDLRMRLLPYLYTAFARYHFEGRPPIRSVLLEEGTRRVREDNTQFSFGPDILAAPFLDEATERKVTLPPGRWFDFYSGELAGEGATISVAAKETHDLPPLFVRDGALIPMLSATSIPSTQAAQGGVIEIRHYGNRSGSCRVYEDDGVSTAYARGAVRWREFTLEDGELRERTVSPEGPALWGAARLVRMTP